MGIQVFSHWTRTDLTWTWNNCKIIYDIYLYSYHTIYVWQFDVNLTAYIIMLKGATNANSCRFPPSLYLSLSVLFVLFLQQEHPAVLTNRGSRKATVLLLDIPSLLYYAYWVKFGMRNLFTRVFVRVPLAAFLGFGVDYRIASHN